MFRSSHIFVFQFLIFWLLQLRDFLSVFFHLALQNVNKNYMIFSYFRNFFQKSNQKPNKKNGMNEKIRQQLTLILFSFSLHKKDVVLAIKCQCLFWISAKPLVIILWNGYNFFQIILWKHPRWLFCIPWLRAAGNLLCLVGFKKMSL